MKILVVDDEKRFVERTTEELRKAGLDINGIVAGYQMETPDGQSLTEGDVLALVRGADVIFLDHNMPSQNGENLFRHWQEQGVDFSAKRVIGTSSDDQPYLHEQFNAMYLSDATALKQLLGII